MSYGHTKIGEKSRIRILFSTMVVITIVFFFSPSYKESLSFYMNKGALMNWGLPLLANVTSNVSFFLSNTFNFYNASQKSL